MGVVYVIEGSRTYPTDQVTGEEVALIVPRSTASANTGKMLEQYAWASGRRMRKQVTYGEMDEVAAASMLLRMPFDWKSLRVFALKSISHVTRDCDRPDV